MAQELDISVLPWSPLAGGLLTGKYNKRPEMADDNSETAVDSGRGNWITDKLDDRNIRIANVVQKIAQEIGRSPAQVALNWLLQKNSNILPIIGARTIKQLEDNLSCLDFVLSPEYMDYLDGVSQIDLGFPHAFINSDMVKDLISGGTNITTSLIR